MICGATMKTTHTAFNQIAKGKTPPPFSLRLSFEERAKLEEAANGLPLGAYVKAKLFESDLPKVRRWCQAAGRPSGAAKGAGGAWWFSAVANPQPTGTGGEYRHAARPPRDRRRKQTSELAIGGIESELGLEGQPRAIVFHEKEGRRHAHAVWSRIDGEEMKAINLPFYKRALNGIARDLYLESGWEMPTGFRDQRQRDPFGCTREEWQQAKRTHQDPKAIKRALQEFWNASDNRAAFEAALRERGVFPRPG